MKKSRLKQYFKRASVAGLGLFMFGGIMEWTGYNILNMPNGDNIACTIDSSCRSLTEGEKKMAKDYFGDRIDPDKVKIFSRGWMRFPSQGYYPTLQRVSKAEKKDGKTASFLGFRLQPYSYNMLSPNGNIYFRDDSYTDDFSRKSTHGKALFLHELTHVFQHQSGKNLVSRALKIALKSSDEYSAHYSYDIDDIDDFSDLNIEQQAELIEDFSLKIERYKNWPSSYKERKIKHYARLLLSHIPQIRTTLENAGINTDGLTPKNPSQPETDKKTGEKDLLSFEAVRPRGTPTPLLKRGLA